MEENQQNLYDLNIEREKACEILSNAKKLHIAKRYALRIDERTWIMVSKKNFNRTYAQAYKARMNDLNCIRNND